MSQPIDPKIFDTLLEPTFVIDADKKVIYCNEPAALICDVSARKVQRSQTPLDELFKFKETVQGLSDLKSVTEATSYQELGFDTLSGKSGKVQITIQPLQDAWLVYFRDVTLEETLQKKYRAELEQKEDVINDLRKAQAELKNYSENLEKMVAERTAEVSRLNQTMSALLDSLSQGFFLFDKAGVCLEVYSKACLNTVEMAPAGKKIWEVLALQDKEIAGFKKWMDAAYAEMLPFEDMAPLAPQNFPHSEKKHIQLQYYPLRDKENSMQAIVVVASDITSLIQAQQAAENERAHAKMIVTLVKNKFHFTGFLREAQEILKELQAVFQRPTFDAEAGFRLLHTMKGGSATFSIHAVAEICHEAETALTHWKEERTLARFQELKEISAKIPLQFNQFLTDNRAIIGDPEHSKQRWVEASVDSLRNFISAPQFPSSLQAKFTEEFLMEPAHRLIGHYSEVVQQVATSEGKDILPLELQNSEIKIIPEPYETLFSTLIHAYRNAVDHGIEVPSVREAAGKARAGKIQTRFSVEGAEQSSWLQIQISDDGGGIDPAKIRARLSTKGIPHAGEDDQQIIQHVFDSQFSTKEAVTQTSGRGVGMDAILYAARQLGGKAWVESKVGVGSTLFIRVPYFSQISALKKTA